MFRVYKPYCLIFYKNPVVIHKNVGKLVITDKIAAKVVKKKDAHKTIYDKIIESIYFR